MRSLEVSALSLVFHCPLNLFGFPSVSPFWTVSNPACFNDLRSDYPLNSPSVEWLNLGPRLDPDVVCRLLRRSLTVTQAFDEFYRRNLPEMPSTQFERPRTCAGVADLHGTARMLLADPLVDNQFLLLARQLVTCSEPFTSEIECSVSAAKNLALRTGIQRDVREEGPNKLHEARTHAVHLARTFAR